MRRVVIAGASFTRVGEHWEKSLGDLVFEAARPLVSALDGRGVDALYIGNMLSCYSAVQSNLGSYAADILGLHDVEAFHVNCAEASGAAAIYQAVLSVRSGRYDVAIAGGAEKMTDLPYRRAVEGVSLSIDGGLVRRTGATLAGLAAIMLKEYMRRYGVSKEMITYLSVQDHRHAVTAEHAQFRREITLKQAMEAPPAADPLTVYDVSPLSDGAAFVLVTTEDVARDMGARYVEVAGIGMAVSTLSVIDRNDMLDFSATRRACGKALREAGVSIDDVDVLEVNDDFSITGVLSLEALGLFEEGQAARMVYEGRTSLGGEKPVNTFGGLKARGHPVGATGAYQVSEVYLQLTGGAGANQVGDPKIGLVHNYGGLDSTTVVIVLRKPT